MLSKKYNLQTAKLMPTKNPLFTCFLIKRYLFAVLESEPYIGFAVDCGEVHEGNPESFVKLGYQTDLSAKFDDKGFHQLATRLFYEHQFQNFFEPRFRCVEPLHQTAVAFLVFRLLESEAGIFLDTLLNQFGGNRHLILQLRLLRVEKVAPHQGEVGDILHNPHKFG